MSTRDQNYRCKVCGMELPYMKACLCDSCKEKMLLEKHLCGCGCGKMILRWNLTHCGNIREKRFEFHHPTYKVNYGDKPQWEKISCVEILKWLHVNLACPACGKRFGSLKSMYDHFDSRRTICIEIDTLNKIRHKVENEYTCHCGCGKRVKFGRLGLGGHTESEPWNKGMTKEDDERLMQSSVRRLKEMNDNLKGVAGKSITSIEWPVRKILDKLGLKYIHQYNFKNMFLCDFGIPSKKFLIECDGDYWHNYPKGLPKDKIRARQAKQAGWKMLRFWEREINNDLDLCEYKIRRVLKCI